MAKNNYRKTLVIGDAHDDPRFSKERFIALGNYIAQEQPDYVVQIGDFINLDSISFHNRRRPLVKEGYRLADDLESAQQAYDLTMEPLYSYNKTKSRVRKKQYKPKMFWLEGNHEYRTRRYVEELPELSGFLPEGSLVEIDRDLWTPVDYKDHCWIEGCMVTHAPINPGSGQPIGGKYVTRRALEHTSDTIIFGHNHVRQFDAIRRADHLSKNGRRVDSICVGCYFDYDPEYVRDVAKTLNWWRGLVVLTHVGKGEVDIETISIDRVKQQYL